MAVATDISPRPAVWVGAGLAGGVWGLGLARVLATELHVAIAYRWAGAALIALTGVVLALLAQRQLRRSGAAHNVLWSLPLALPLIDLLAPAAQPWRGPALLGGGFLLSMVVLLRPTRLQWLLLSVFVPLAVYLPDLSPYVGRADTFEFQVIGPQLGIAHPSGYPLYTLLCKLFSLLPVSTVAWRINLSSAVLAALAAGSLYLALTESSDNDAPWWQNGPAWCAAMALAFSPTLWSRAIEAEVYALNAFLVAAGLWLTVRWQTGHLAPSRAWPALGLLVGLALASHVTLGALGLLAAAGLLARRRWPDRRAWGPALGLGLAGLALYAYIPLRWPAVTGGERMAFSAFLRFVTNAGSGGALRPLAFVHDPARWSLVGERLLAQAGWPGLILAAAGFAGLVFSAPPLAVGTLAAFAAWVWFGLSFYVADPDYSAFLIPAHVVLFFWLGQGAAAVVRYLPGVPARLRLSQRGAQTGGGRGSRAYGIAGVVLLGLLVFGQIWRTGPQLDTISQGRADELWARYVLRLPLAEGAAILADSEKFPPLYYLQQVADLRPDLELVTLFSEAQYRADLETRLAAGQVVYLARYLPGMDAFGVSAVGPFVQISPAGSEQSETVSGLAFGADLRLTAHALEADPEGRSVHHLTLTWAVDAQPEEDLEVKVRLVDPATGGVVWQGDGTRPVAGYTTTTAWEAGRQIDDYHPLVWPAWLPPGLYDLQVGLSPRFTDRMVPVGPTHQAWADLESVAVPPQTAPDLPVRLDALYDGVGLLGVAAPGEVAAGRGFALDLAWRCASATESLPALQAHWLSATTGELSAVALQPVGGGGDPAPCGVGAPSTLLRRYQLTVPLQPGAYSLALGSADGDVRCGWLRSPSSACHVTDLVVTSEAAGIADFAGKILLMSADVDATDVPAGGPLRVELTWRAQQRLTEDYTVFVQVIGPDGQLHGQVDSWPVQGTRPTSSWATSETVGDPYMFYVDADPPPGDYRVIVGWYLLADMSRLPVWDAAGREVGDFLQIGTIKLP